MKTKAETILEKYPSVKMGLDDFYGRQTVLNIIEEALSAPDTETWLEIRNELKQRLSDFEEKVKDFPMKFHIGDEITVHSGIPPLHTEVTDVKWCDFNKTWQYYFISEDGNEYFEWEEAITFRDENL